MKKRWLHQKMIKTLSIRARFLISPFIAITLIIILYLTSNQIIQSNNDLFKQLNEANLIQVNEISHVSILLTESNSEIITLLLESDELDEEAIYEEGKAQLNQLYRIESRLGDSIDEKDELKLNGKNIYAEIKSAFYEYRMDVISAIEMSSVDSKQASEGLVLANKKLKILNQLFLNLSDYYSHNLAEKSLLVSDSLYKKNYVNELTILLIALMLWFAFYFSNTTSIGIIRVYKALVSLSEGNTNVRIQKNSDAYIKDLWTAVAGFKESIISSEAYKNDLIIQKFAMDQHSIIASTDKRGTITSVNTKFCEISGYTQEELIGNNHRILNSAHHPKEFWRDMYQCVSQGNVWHNEVLNKAKDGHLYWVDTSIIPVVSVNDKKTITGYIAIRTDITDKKNQYKKLIDAKVVAESAVVAKSRFLASMSHEIRTPMNGVLGMLDLMLHHDLDPEQKSRADLAYGSAKSLLNLINDILDFSKIDENKLELESIDFNLQTLLQETVDFLIFEMEKKHLTLTFDMQNIDESLLVGDPGRIRQILINIIGNAIKFTSEGTINIKATLQLSESEHCQLVCSVTDTGIGIAPDKINNLFNSFSQVDVSTTRKYGGTGLGLAISKRLAQLMSGDIKVTSVEGEGSRFTCIIPLLKSKEPLQDKNQEPTKLADLVIPEWPPKTKILLVEDNRINQQVAKGVLKRFGLIPDLAVNGKDALEKLSISASSYSIILMDCQMPEMDGYEATKYIRSQQDSDIDYNIPIIAMTANAMKGDREKCLDAGMNDYLSKPIDPRALLEKLSLWLIENKQS